MHMDVADVAQRDVTPFRLPITPSRYKAKYILLLNERESLDQGEQREPSG
jgi:hypothetical protein